MSSNLHPDSKLNPCDHSSNDSSNPSIHDLIQQRELSRREFLSASLGTTATLALMGSSITLDSLTHEAEAAPSPRGGIRFASVPANVAPMTDAVTVPANYTAKVLIGWGDSLTTAPHWDSRVAMDEATQLRTFGAHIDGMHYFPYSGFSGNRRGLLVTNHEYVDPPLVNHIAPASAYNSAPLTLNMVRAQQAGHGVSVVDIEFTGGEWTVRRSSEFNRRITANTRCQIRGPAAGHALLKTPADPKGELVNGTLNNCAHGATPWGTYLTCEENWNGYFGTKDPAFTPTNHERRYGVTANGFGYRWHEVDPRFDLATNRNEPNRFGWVVEIDPWNPKAPPLKRTALGRFKHESAMVVVDDNNKVAVYMGDDERNEYVYKFVSALKHDPINDSENNRILEAGTLYVAKFNADGTGVWMPLVWGQNGLTPENGFADQGEVLIKTRQAADRLGATMMDRPEWAAAHPVTREIYLTLTNNSRRGNNPASMNQPDGSSNAGSANPPVDTANPRPDNDFGHIIRWRDNGGNVDATTFEWDIFVQCGDKATTKTLGASYTATGHDGYKGNIKGDDYGAPDGLWFDRYGRLWIQTDQIGNATGDWINIGGNAMLCADPNTGETRRFLTSPPHCEVTGITSTPDSRTFFVGIQHPGEDWSTSFTQNSTWPDSGVNGPTTQSSRGPSKPRSSVVVITKNDGGFIGT